MRVIGLDIGTTTICAVVVDGKTGEIIETITTDNDSFIASEHVWEKIQDPLAIYTKAKEIVENLSLKHAPVGCIGVTGQMHGIVYVDEKGDAVSPLYTWQDGRGDLAYEGGRSYAEVLAQKTQYKLATGYGSVSHFYNLCNHLVPAEARFLCTIHDYVAMKLAQRSTPLIDATDAASLGLFDIDNNAFDRQAVRNAGMDEVLFPDVAQGETLLGTTGSQIPVAIAIGDNQASFLGSVRNKDEGILVNVGTGSQISLFSNRHKTCPPIETRPFMKDGFLLVGAPLCGGRAYALLETFFRATVQMTTGKECPPLYEVMEKSAEEFLKATNKLEISTTFGGTREQPAQRGTIGNVGIDNFTPQHFIAGVLEGMVKELHNLYENMASVLDRKPTLLVGSGNGIRKNVLLQRIFSEKFSMPLRIPVYKEEAAYGAALFALTGVGYYKDISQVQAIIRYQDEQ